MVVGWGLESVCLKRDAIGTPSSGDMVGDHVLRRKKSRGWRNGVSLSYSGKLVFLHKSEFLHDFQSALQRFTINVPVGSP
jgi:hypothetical protein